MDFQGGHFTQENMILIFEWNGTNFSPLIRDGFAKVYFSSSPILQDIDNNKTIELILKNTLPLPIPSRYAHLIPWRNEALIYFWDGEYFSKNQVEFEIAKYRFQAIQDGDQASKNKKYQTAQEIYQEGIFNNQLLPWSKEILENEIAKSFAYDGFRDSPTSIPPNPSEYPSLASYAYYRIMLLQLVQGQTEEANQTYQTLLNTFGNDIYAKPYIEMTTDFLEAYQVNQSMYDGCAAAIQYAVEHPEILIPLGSDYHGSQAKIYTPADVCPFR